MIEYRLDMDAYNYLCEWSELFRSQTKWSPAYSKKSAVVLKGYDKIVLYTEERKELVKFSLKDASGQIAKGSIKQDSEGKHDFLTKVTPTVQREKEEMQKLFYIVQLFLTSYVEANCFMWHGNVIDKKTYQAVGRNDGTKKIVTFRKFQDSIYAVPIGHHKSPEGVFSVRGHFRRLQSGKVIWIDEYLKGVE